MRFEWDPAKDEANQRRHGVSFSEASELLRSDVDYLEMYDDAHASEEERFIAIGPIKRGLVLVVWSERPEGTIRLISARWATPIERRLFRDYMGKST